MSLQLASRAGSPPCTTPGPPPEQLTQVAPAHWQRTLDARARTLPGIHLAGSYTCPAGSLALHLAARLAHGPAEAFFDGTEIAHVHPVYDGSVHLKLPPGAAAAARGAGWARDVPPRGSLLLFGPRNAQETEVVWQLLLSAYHFASHPSTGTPAPHAT